MDSGLLKAQVLIKKSSGIQIKKEQNQQNAERCDRHFERLQQPAE